MNVAAVFTSIFELESSARLETLMLPAVDVTSAYTKVKFETLIAPVDSSAARLSAPPTTVIPPLPVADTEANVLLNLTFWNLS